MGKPKSKPTRMHLIFDQVETLPLSSRSRLRRAKFRIRHWAREGVFPVVLVTKAEDDSPWPGDHTDVIATWIYTRLLKARDGFFYVEDNGKGSLELVNFRCQNLRWLSVDSKQFVTRHIVSQAIGVPVP